MNSPIFKFWRRAAQLERIELRLLQIVNQLETIIMAQQTIEQKLDDAIADITESSTIVESLSGVIATLRQQVADEIAKEKVTPELRAKIDQVFDGAEANRAKLAGAMVANTPEAGVGATPINPV